MRTAPDLRRLLGLAGWLTAAVVAVSAATSGLPAAPGDRVVTVVLTVVGVALWCLALLPRVTDVRVLTVAMLGTGIAGAVLDLVHPSGPGLPRRLAVPAAVVVAAAAAGAEAATSDHPLSAALTLLAGAG